MKIAVIALGLMLAACTNEGGLHYSQLSKPSQLSPVARIEYEMTCAKNDGVCPKMPASTAATHSAYVTKPKDQQKRMMQ